jgi:hypothetical protein
VAYFDRAVPPGGEGKVTIRINTKGYEGEIRKSARVYTNDPRRRIEVLTVKALVTGAISLTPRSVYLSGEVGRDIAKTVTVTAEEDKPLKLEPSGFNLSGKVEYRIEEVDAGREFRVHFTGISNDVGIYRGFLKLKTNYPERPEITIWIKAKFLKSG